MHLTIALMSLVRDPKSNVKPGTETETDMAQPEAEGVHAQELPTTTQRTINEALNAFESCRSVVSEIVKKPEFRRFEVSFDRLSTFQHDLKKCRVSKGFSPSFRFVADNTYDRTQVLYAEPTSNVEPLYELASE